MLLWRPDILLWHDFPLSEYYHTSYTVERPLVSKGLRTALNANRTISVLGKEMIHNPHQSKAGDMYFLMNE